MTHSDQFNQGPNPVRTDTSAVHSAGQIHYKPNRSVHTVKPGETVESVAAMYGVSVGELMQLNGHQLSPSLGIVQPGTRLQI